MSLSKWINKRFTAWLNKRIPTEREVVLDQRRIFIFPSRLGLLYLFVLLLVLLAAINFENSMAFALAFWLGAALVVTIHHTYANMSGIRISAGQVDPVFCGEQAQFSFLLSAKNKRKTHYAIALGWNGDDLQSCDFSNEKQEIRLNLTAKKRGVFTAPRVFLQTHYPMGIIRAWSWVSIDTSCLVYPKPIENEYPENHQSSGNNDSDEQTAGMDEYHSTRDYQLGDHLSHVSWKRLAKGQKAQTKLFASAMQETQWLDWQDFGVMDTERKLSYLCYWILEYDKKRISYGLRMPNVELTPAFGPEHKTAALEALARYGLKT